MTKRTKRPLGSFFDLVVLLSLLTGLQSDASGLEHWLRRPVGLAVSSDVHWLYTANQNSGSVSVVDITNRSVVDEIRVGGRLSDLDALDDEHLLVLDEQNHQLVMLSRTEARWAVATRLELPDYPVRLEIDHHGRRCFVASLWSQVVTVVDLSEVEQERQPRLHAARKLRLPFEPREMCLAAREKRLIVASSFDGRLAVVDTDGLDLIAVKNVPGHNIRGLAMSGDGERVLATQQELNPLARSTRDDVHWGNMLSNLLVSFSFDDVCDSESDALKHRVVIPLGEPGSGAGDPGRIRIGPNGKIAILLSGVNEVALGGDNENDSFRRVPVGRGPSAAVTVPDGRMFVAERFADSISILDAAAKQIDRVSLGPRPELSLVQRGEMLFFDSRLSHDGWMSCHSCHTDGHSNGQLNDNLSDGSFDAPKRVLSLLGVGQTGPWAWTGRVETLEQQVASSIQNTMQGEAPDVGQVAAIVAYLDTLPAPPSSTDLGADGNVDETDRGETLFESLLCHRCHRPPTYTTPHSYDVGLADSVGNREFNPPSLRGVGRRRSFFHDARAASLTDVFAIHEHQLTRELSTSELESLLHFLRSI